jgi:SAM-dependent methyltransferase
LRENIFTGWEMEKRTHFDEIVENYDRIRPDYPIEIFEDVIKYSGLRKGGKALEIGAGTGKATGFFVKSGYDVTAVEIGANMAGFLHARFDGYDNFRVVVSSFEEAALEGNSYDQIYAASAFHWVNADIGCPKVFHWLKNGGAVALIRYNSIPAPGHERLYEDIDDAYMKHYFSYYTSKRMMPDNTKEIFYTPKLISEGYGFEDLRAYGFTDVTMSLYEKELAFTADEFIVFKETLADHRGLPDENKAALYAGVKEAVNKHGGLYRDIHVFQLYMGKK